MGFYFWKQKNKNFAACLILPTLLFSCSGAPPVRQATTSNTQAKTTNWGPPAGQSTGLQGLYTLGGECGQQCQSSGKYQNCPANIQIGLTCTQVDSTCYFKGFKYYCQGAVSGGGQ